MKRAVHWQDSDSSSAKAVVECFPECKIMICGGHASKNHLKALENYSKMKAPSIDFIRKHKDRFPLISGVCCHCPKRHSQGCGCITDAFIMRARNNFSYILTDSKSAEEFVKRLRVLPRHVRDEHEWEVMEEEAEPTRTVIFILSKCVAVAIVPIRKSLCVKEKITLHGTGSRVRFTLSFMKLSVTIEPQWLTASFILC